MKTFSFFVVFFSFINFASAESVAPPLVHQFSCESEFWSAQIESIDVSGEIKGEINFNHIQFPANNSLIGALSVRANLEQTIEQGATYSDEKGPVAVVNQVECQMSEGDDNKGTHQLTYFGKTIGDSGEEKGTYIGCCKAK